MNVFCSKMVSTVTRSQSHREFWNVVDLEIRIKDVQSTNRQGLHDTIMSIWTKIKKECFLHLVESMPRRIQAVLKTKGLQSSTNMVFLWKEPVSVYITPSFHVVGKMDHNLTSNGCWVNYFTHYASSTVNWKEMPVASLVVLSEAHKEKKNN